MKSLFQELCKAPRTAGSPRIREIRDYIISLLEGCSYNIESRCYPFTGWELLEEPKFSFIKPVEKSIKCIPVVWSGSTEKEISGKVAPNFNVIKTFEAYPWQVYSVTDIRDKVVAKLMTRPDMVWAQPLDNYLLSPPHLILEVEACKLINSWIVEKRDIEVKMCVKSKYLPNEEIANIIAATNHAESNIIISTHYDSMFNTVGAHDNASGTVALIELAKYFATRKIDCLKFAFFDAEEWNKFGSYSYVDELKADSTLNQIKLVVNVDSVGVGETIYILTSPLIESQVRNIIRKLVKPPGINIEITSSEQFPQFDSWPFMKNGIPVIQIGTRGANGFPYFHHPKDDMSNIDLSQMERIIFFLRAFITDLLKEEIQTGG